MADPSFKYMHSTGQEVMQLQVRRLTIDAIVNQTEKEDFKLKSLIREVILSDSFLQSN